MTIAVDDFDLDIHLGAAVDMPVAEKDTRTDGHVCRAATKDNCFTAVIPRTCACA